MASVPSEVSPESIDERFAVRRSSAVHTVEVDGEAVLLNDGRLHLLNATGALVWACFDGDGTMAEIATDISEGFGVYETVLDDTLAVARELGAEGLLASVTPTVTDATAEAVNTDGVAGETASPWSSDPQFVDEPPNP